MSSDQGPIVQSALLRSELVRLRKEKKLTQEQVARQLQWSPSKLIRVEGGKNAITRTDLPALLGVYDVTSEGARSGCRRWPAAPAAKPGGTPTAAISTPPSSTTSGTRRARPSCASSTGR